MAERARAETEATREAYVEADPRCAPDLGIVFDDGLDEPGDASAIDAASIP